MKKETKETIQALLVDEQARNAAIGQAMNMTGAIMADEGGARAQMVHKAVSAGVGFAGKQAAKLGTLARALSTPEGQKKLAGVLGKKKKDNAHDQWVDFKYWLKLWIESLSMIKGDPLKMSDAMLRYPWIIDMLKTGHMRKTMTEGRGGYSLEAMSAILVEETKSTVRILQNIVLDPENTVLSHVAIPGEILQAMRLKNFTMETAANIIGMVDQHAPEKYLDTMYAAGLPDNTCSYSTQTPGIWRAGDAPKKAACIITTNLPCEAHFEGYSMMVRDSGLPTYWLDVPYNFKQDEEGLAAFVEDIKGMIAFLTEHTGHEMDWDELRIVCERHNKLVRMERERWELNRTDKPPMTGDLLWQAHMWAFELDASTQAGVELFEKLRYMGLENYRTKTPACKNQRYRVMQWSTPAFMYMGMHTWLERCWGITLVNDMETFGDLHEIDTSTPDTMLAGLGVYWADGAMVRHMRGKSENWTQGLDDMYEMYQPDFVLNCNHLNCRGYVSLTGYFAEWSRENQVPVCNVDYNFFDPRVVSRQGIRDQVNNFMINIIHATPLDESLLEFDDSEAW